MRAIDLYSGVGGWALGLAMAGIETVESYEWWDRAAETHRQNLRSNVREVDIRQLSLEELPDDIDVVVGSPPCTEFSFANRGGNGDLAEGLKDVAKFLEVVEHLRPTYWAMENVPRVAGILRRELGPGGSLERFADLVDVIEVLDFSDLGLPQGRRRMVAGSYPIDLVRQYQAEVPRLHLSQVLEALRSDPVVDPLYDIKVFADELTEHVAEAPLDAEEERMNREAKTYHPVYNRMQFPDEVDRPARTITALCTRISRESIVVDAPDIEGYRRLTLRERATLQGFPMTFEFFGTSYSHKLKLIGNALPPPAAYYIGMAMLGTEPDDLVEPTRSPYAFSAPETRPDDTPPPISRSRYPRNRSYRAALPGLRFGSGMRFELSNDARKRSTRWEVRFYYGTSKRVRQLELTEQTASAWISSLPAGGQRAVATALEAAPVDWASWSGQQMQDRWRHEDEEGPHPFEITDQIGQLAADIREAIADVDDETLAGIVMSRLESADSQRGKLTSYAREITSGVIAGAHFNQLRAAIRS